MKIRIAFPRWAATALALCAVASLVQPTHASPIHPTSDDEVIDVLPAVSGNRAEERRMRKLLAQRPRDPQLALSLAKRYLAQAHESGDPRFAGMAFAAIEPWSDDASAPDDVLMMRATLQQYMHEFDTSVATLQKLLARNPSRPQAWLTLATVRRVQGRYADSDAACREVSRAGAALYSAACLAENAALRGDVAPSRATFVGLIAANANNPDMQAWLTTSLAELEQRAGNPSAAEAAFKTALRLDPDPYTTLDYADLLIEQKRPAEALAQLKGQVRSDPVLLRLAIAGKQANAPTAASDIAEMRDRIQLANERPDAKVFHGREQAMFALAVDGDARLALDLARGNAAKQREPLDLYVLAQAARASGDAKAVDDAKRLTAEMGLVDQRSKGLL